MRAFIVIMLIAAAVALGCSVIIPEAQALLPALPASLSLGDHYSICCTVPPLLAGYLSEAQLAKQLGRTARTLWRWRKLRIGPPPTMVTGGKPMYRIAAVEQWLLSREQRMPRERSRSRQRANNEARAP